METKLDIAVGLAPVVLFVYNRPSHTRQTLLALKENDLANESSLFIFADGPKAGASQEELNSVARVREILREERWCKDVHIVERTSNVGLAKSIIDGVTEIVDRFEKIIVLEDDLVCTRGFLRYMNECLELYRSSGNVFSVTGYMFPLKESSGASRTVLLPYISTWGWGTWKDKWQFFKKDYHSSELIIHSDELSRMFNLSDYDYRAILDKSFQSSWGIRWYFSVFCHHGLTVFPTRSMVQNIGMDGSGTHRSKSDFQPKEVISDITVNFTNEIDLKFWDEYMKFFRNRVERNPFRILLRKIRALLSMKRNYEG